MDSTHDLPFRFLALPPELRDYIYRDVLATTYLVELPLPQVYLSARAYGQIPPSQHPASSRLAILQVRFLCSSSFLEASFLEELGKLTGFKTVVVNLKVWLWDESAVRKLKASKYDMIDEYLTLMLGAGEAGKFDEAGWYCLMYHPRGRAGCKKAALV